MPWHDEGVDDRALVDAIRSGDRDAFRILIERETRAVYGASLRILGNRADAEDVAQEAFVAAFRAIGSYRGDGTLRAWLLRIATRLSLRRRASRREAVDISDVGEPAALVDRTEPSRVVVAAEHDESIRRAVASLPDPYRETVALRFFADLSLAEVADTTGRPLNTVKTHLRRGLERLRPILGGGAASE